MHLDKIFQILQRTESNTNKITLCFMIEDQSITRTIEAKWRKLLNIGIYMFTEVKLKYCDLTIKQTVM